jgi:hypothetical protein
MITPTTTSPCDLHHHTIVDINTYPTTITYLMAALGYCCNENETNNIL